MSVKDLFEEIVNVEVLKECDEMFVDPNCLVAIYNILSDHENNSKLTRAEITTNIVTEIQDELFGYDFYQDQILFIYDLALKNYIKKHSSNDISLNSLYTKDIRDNLTYSYITIASEVI